MWLIHILFGDIRITPYSITLYNTFAMIFMQRESIYNP